VTGCDRLSQTLKSLRQEAQPVSLSTRANAELLSEMIQVVLGAKPQPQEFAGLLDSLEQGASLEGVYNGLIHSARYRELESSVADAPGGAVRAETLSRFVAEMLELQLAMKEPTRWTPEAAQPLARMELDPAAPDVPKTFAPPPSSGRGALTEAQLRELFQYASRFTLKRVIGDEALRLLTEKRTDSEGRARWYGEWVVGISRRGGDFGLAQRSARSSDDASFHSQWAQEASEDRIVWEVLNRLHRVLN
jgi:hypothetical protein